jgi:hypothetical protein
MSLFPACGKRDFGAEVPIGIGGFGLAPWIGVRLALALRRPALTDGEQGNRVNELRREEADEKFVVPCGDLTSETD